MDSVIGRIQTEADDNGKRTDIHLNTGIKAIKVENDINLKEIIENLGVGVTVSNVTPDHSSLWIIPDAD